MSFVCPYCAERHAAVACNFTKATVIGRSRLGDRLTLEVGSFACSKPSCKELTLTVSLGIWQDQIKDGIKNQIFKPLGQPYCWDLLPESRAVPQPECVPAHLQQDYKEASRIADLSPKASATLARRCLQSMIRDFCGINERTLHDSIVALRDAVTDHSAPREVDLKILDAIDGIRQLGNIGAHMQQQAGMIVDVDPEEAHKMLKLIEMLFKEWYVARDTRNKRIDDILQITEAKFGPAPTPEPKTEQ